MARKNESPPRQNLSPEGLRKLAELIEQYAQPYRQAADLMDSVGMNSIGVTGMDTFSDRALPLMRSHSAKILREVQAEADIRQIAGITDPNYEGSAAEDPENFVAGEKEVTKKKTAKRKKRS
ncbi:MAG: hypothetical protein AAF394_06350 [Planctomycetota bacterium]